MPPGADDKGLSPRLIQSIVDRVRRGQSVRRALPGGGRIHIDRPLPFIVVYRIPPKRADRGTKRLAIGEASYLVVPGDRQYRAGTQNLVRELTRTMVEKFGAFLVLEIWSGHDDDARLDAHGDAPPPAFRLISGRSKAIRSTVEALDRALSQIVVFDRKATVELVRGGRRAPLEMPQLVPPGQLRKLGGFLLGLEVRSIYRDADNGAPYPLTLRALDRQMARSMLLAFYEFSQEQTSYREPHYQTLGRRAVVKAVWDVDRSLAEVSDAFDFLLAATPVNLAEAWAAFRRSKFQKTPAFRYRPLPVDPPLLKRKLYDIPIERVEDPTLAFLFRSKRTELDRHLTMLLDRNTKRFLWGSLLVYGEVNDQDLNEARRVLETLSPRSRETGQTAIVSPADFVAQAAREINRYRKVYPTLTSKASVRTDIVGLMVSKGDLLVGNQTRIPKSRVEALIQHEVGTHILTYANGKAQPFQQLHTGLPDYEELQEGLAVFSEYMVGGLSRPRLRLLAARVDCVHAMVQGATFIETFRRLNQKWGFSQRVAFTIAMRVYRGGGLTKDAVYFKGLVRLLSYLKRGGELEPLFVGKIPVDAIPMIKELQWRRVLNPAPLRPSYLNRPDSRKRLDAARHGMDVIDLIR
ncbi:MAG: DUF1704 domain-containing protein [Deltaproteobacteria bacterium]|nr:DUF1704 domain-containing protein [Deltaproteobacteria bacterium]MCB9480075.1 DUF1704 domain-containing protein [Deltaproteobacteria bacterium]MCB9487133.1 DUF1704 domain-containing protein [Deltaproteobacteria bacterium]